MQILSPVVIWSDGFNFVLHNDMYNIPTSDTGMIAVSNCFYKSVYH